MKDDLKPDGNGDGLELMETPAAEEDLTPGQLAMMEQLFNHLAVDQQLMVHLGANIAWLEKHPGSTFAKTAGQMQKRLDYLGTLDKDAGERLGRAIKQMFIHVVRSLAQFVQVEERPQGPTIWTPPPPGGRGTA